MQQQWRRSIRQLASIWRNLKPQNKPLQPLKCAKDERSVATNDDICAAAGHHQLLNSHFKKETSWDLQLQL
jgi:hypothetical protein